MKPGTTFAALLFLTLISFFLCGGLMSEEANSPLPEVVPHVDIRQYMGTWYEIARYPNRFQRNCLSSTATYSLREDGKVTVLNQCTRKDDPLKTDTARGKAWIVDPISNAKLKVSFFWPFSGDYWIIGLAPDYSYAVVGHPKRKYLWILSRTPKIERETFSRIITDIRARGYDPTRLIVSPSQQEYLE